MQNYFLLKEIKCLNITKIKNLRIILKFYPLFFGYEYN